ncbi:MAG: restriction endonuclease, partial [Patescibacteria group bacterium]
MEIPLKIFFTFWPLFLMLIAAFIFKKFLISLTNRSKYKRIKTLEEIRALTPKQFEEYTAFLFRKLGYTTEVVGRSHDGGIDIIATKNGKRHLIQCKKYSNKQVPVGAVRDFYGAISDDIEAKGYFITTQTFTLDAEKFAEGKPIELIDQFKLMKYIELAHLGDIPQDKVCPKCGSKLVFRNGKYGPFMGC